MHRAVGMSYGPLSAPRPLAVHSRIGLAARTILDQSSKVRVGWGEGCTPMHRPLRSDASLFGLEPGEGSVICLRLTAEQATSPGVPSSCANSACRPFGPAREARQNLGLRERPSIGK